MAEYIEKQAALDIVNGWRDQLIPTYGKNDEYVLCLETVAERLESLHTADVRPVVLGKWKVTSIYIKCLRCGKCFMLIPQNFCPNCGADMRETKE